MEGTKIIERYNGHVGVSGAWLADCLGKNVYDNGLKRGSVRSLRRGGNGRTALIDWQSMGTKMKAKVIEALGCDPAQMSRETLLRSILERREQQLLDTEAYEYYSHVTGKDGHYLKPEKVTELWNGAKILDAISELLEEKRRAAEMGRLKMSVKREFEALAAEIDQQLVEWPNSLPTSGDRLRKKWNEYRLHGYEVLVHGLTGKESNHRRAAGVSKADAEAVVEALLMHGAELNDVQVSKAAESLGVKIDRRRVQEIRKKNEMMITKSREGKSAYSNEVMMQAKRERPDMPMKMWSLDGWTCELYYQDTKIDKKGHRRTTYLNRLILEVVVDVMNDYPIGYAIGEQENIELITAALQDAVHHTREVFGGYYAPWQIQSDHLGLSAMKPKYQALAKYVTPASVGNAKSKPIERYFGYLQSEYLFMCENYAGHGITAKTRKRNDQYLNDVMKSFPDRAGVEAQIKKMIEIDRARKIGAVREAWANGEESMRRPFNMEGYLLAFGERSRGNMLMPSGLKLIREGQEHVFDCFDLKMREQRGERWQVCYDPADWNQALAMSEDGTLRYMIEAKAKVPMALVDYEDGDWETVARVRAFNNGMYEAVVAHEEAVIESANGFITRQQIEGPLSVHLVTDRQGQHKVHKRAEQKRLAAVAGYTEYEEVEESHHAVDMNDFLKRF